MNTAEDRMEQQATKLIGWRKRWLALMEERRQLVSDCAAANVPLGMIASMVQLSEQECNTIIEQLRWSPGD